MKTHTGPLFILFYTLLNLGLVDVIHRMEWIRRHSFSGDRRWLEGCVPVALRTCRLPLTARTTHPGDVHFPQDHCHPPILYIP